MPGLGLGSARSIKIIQIYKRPSRAQHLTKPPGMFCESCKSQFHGHSRSGVLLTIVCGKCATSTDLITKTAALGMGATLARLRGIRCLSKSNPHYRSAADMQLFVREEVDVLVAQAAARRLRLQQEAVDAKQRASDRRDLVKKARRECQVKRIGMLKGIVPNPGLVCGDFLTVHTKKPVIGVRNLLRRKDLWHRIQATCAIPDAVRVFHWATRNDRTDATAACAQACMEHEKFLFGKVAVAEGHRVLCFLDDIERLTLCSSNALFLESAHDLRVRSMSAEFYSLCDTIARRLCLPFATVVRKLDDSVDCWIWRFIYILSPDRVATILAPHFMAPSKKCKVLKERMIESFSRWGVCPEDNTGRVDFFVGYFSGDIVDCEFYSACHYMMRAAVAFFPDVVAAVTSRFLTTPGTTWMDATKPYVEEQLAIQKEEQAMFRRRAREQGERRRMQMHDKYRPPTRTCVCGNKSALMCPFNLCAHCCEGPCDRHGRY